MADEWGSAGAGAAGGAASGAAIGSLAGPVGTVVGGVVGGVAGGVSGYLGGRGASKKKKAAAKARRKYEAAVRKYEQQSLAALAAERERIAALNDRAQANMAARLGGMPGDQSAAFLASGANQSAALQTVQPALAGPLGDQYSQEFAARTQAAIQPMALGYAENDTAQAALANDRQYQLAQAALNPEYERGAMLHNLGQSARDSNLGKARAQFGVKAGGGMAGDEQMMYGGMLSALTNTGMQIGQQQAADARYDRRRDEYYEDAASRNRAAQSIGVLAPRNQYNPALTPKPSAYFGPTR